MLTLIGLYTDVLTTDVTVSSPNCKAVGNYESSDMRGAMSSFDIV